MSLYFSHINISKDFLRSVLLDAVCLFVCMFVLVCFSSSAEQYLAWTLNKYKLNR